MNGKAPLAALGLAVFGLFGVIGFAYFSSPYAVVKDSQASLFLESSIALIRDGSRGVEVSVIGHSYDPPGIREFVSRVYHFYPGYHIELYGTDITSIRTKNVYFIEQRKEDSLSPVAVVFSVNWWVEGAIENHKKVITRGVYNGRLVETSLSNLPPEMVQYAETVSGDDYAVLNLSEIDTKLGLDNSGYYLLEMKGEVNYTFISWSGHRVSNKKNFSVFSANVSYSNGTHGLIKLYYPVNSFKEEIQITHPALVRVKEFFKVI